MNRDELIDALWAGEIGEVEFAEFAFKIGMEAEEVGETLCVLRTEDGVDQ